ncbi:unnamed protein product, partial [Closterium sp. Naga37s-1]
QLEGGEGQQQVRFQSASHLSQHWSTEKSGASETTTSATTATTTSTTTATTTAATTISSITAEGSANGGLTSGSFVSISEAKRQRVAVNENGQEGMGALGNDGSGWGGSTFALASGGLGWGGMGGMGGVGGMGRMGRMGGWSFEELRIATGSDGVDTVVKHPLKLKSAYSQAPGVLDVLLAFHPHPTLDQSTTIPCTPLHPYSALFTPLRPSSPLFAPLHPSTPRHPSSPLFTPAPALTRHTHELEVQRVLDVLPVSHFAHNGAMPTRRWPSDHFSLIAEFTLQCRPQQQ